MLNAFRHQRFNTWNPKASIKSCSSGAQRLSASEIQHCPNFSILIGSSECSTPFGIRDSTQPFGGVMLPQIGCAQRLSASEIQHNASTNAFVAGASVLNAFRHQRFNTLPKHWLLAVRLVLNAFRHQRFNTMSWVGCIHCLLRAQRLSASEIQHSRRAFAREVGVSAQRLSASEIQHQVSKTLAYTFE